MIGIKSIKITPALLNQISEIDQFKGYWSGLERHTTGLQLLSDVADFGAGFHQVLGPLQDRPLSGALICALHAGLFKEKGQTPYRTGDVPLVIFQDEREIGQIQTTSPEDVQALLDKLLQWLNQALADRTLHPLLVCAVFSSVFLQIAPFKTGNFHVLRMLILLILLKAGYAYAPYVSLSALMNDRAVAMYAALSDNQRSLEGGQPEWEVWMTFFFSLLQGQKDVLLQRLYGREETVRNLPALSSRILACFKDHKRLQMKEIIKLTRGCRATIKLRLGELVEQGYLRRYGQARATWYSLS